MPDLPNMPGLPRPSNRASPTSSRRIDAIDLARGVAVVLMILSHGVKGLLSFEQIPSWGLVPIHLITKFSSSLFILVFGLSLAVAYLPYVDTEEWPSRRLKLLTRGLVVFFWYKVLTIVEMSHLYTREDILDTLMYRAFPVYVEILGFYSLALIWIPFVLPLWKRSPYGLRLLYPLVAAVFAHFLYTEFEFWNLESLQAILVEHEKHYTWGQISRSPLVFLGLLIGEMTLLAQSEAKHRRLISGSLILTAALLFLFFWLNSSVPLGEALQNIARNEGKHPPEIQFMFFSVGGALLILAGTLMGGGSLARALRPVTIIGRDALQAFIFHIFVLFVFYRYLFDYWHAVSYPHALTLTFLLIALTALWVKVTDWVQKES